MELCELRNTGIGIHDIKHLVKQMTDIDIRSTRAVGMFLVFYVENIGSTKKLIVEKKESISAGKYNILFRMKVNNKTVAKIEAVYDKCVWVVINGGEQEMFTVTNDTRIAELTAILKPIHNKSRGREG